MSPRGSTRIAVVGAGIGGLALAQAVGRAESELLVLERDTSLGAPGRQVRIHCDARLADLAADILPPDIGELFTAAQSQPDARHIYLDKRLRVTGVEERPRPEIVLDTRTTREVLGVGLGDRLRFGAEVREMANGEIVLTSGERIRAELCVVASGADGTDRRAPFAGRPRDVGLLCWYGCVDLDVHHDLDVPEWLADGFVIALGENRLKVAMGRYEPAAEFTALAGKHDGITARRYVLWNVIAPTEDFPISPADCGQDVRTAARVLADGLFAGWDDWLVGLIGRSAPGTLGSLALRTSAPGDVRPAGASLAYLGDAGHQMLPAALSTYSAFADVALVAPGLAAVARDGTAPAAAVDAVSQRLVETGFASVRAAEDVAGPAFGLELFG